MIAEFKSYHGSALTDLIDEAPFPITLSRPDLSNNSIYCLNENYALYVKHATAKLTPWSFTFAKKHMLDLREICETYEETFLVLVCGRNCIAVIDTSEIYELLDLEIPRVSWISVYTNHNTSLRIEGADGNLKRKVKKSKPFNRVLDIINS